MKKPRRTAPPKARGISKEAQQQARAKLEGDLLGFVSDTATEDPKHYIARMGAASVAIEHLKALAELAGEPPSEDAAEPGTDETLAEARDEIAREGGT